MTKKVLYDDLEFTDGRVYVYEGKPFSGTGIEETAEGSLRSEIEFLDGQQHGWARDYFPEGKISGETPYVAGRRHGVEREWFPCGALREESSFEHGVLMASRRWSEEGKVVDEYTRAADDPLFQAAKKRSLRE